MITGLAQSCTITVGELITMLQQHDKDLPVFIAASPSISRNDKLAYDCTMDGLTPKAEVINGYHPVPTKEPCVLLTFGNIYGRYFYNEEEE